jgi:hypothetical protein
MDKEIMSPLESHIVDHYFFYSAACVMTFPMSRVIEPPYFLSLALLLAWTGATFRLMKKHTTAESKQKNAVLLKKIAKYFIACFALHVASIVMFHKYYSALHAADLRAIADAIPMSSGGVVDPKYDFALMHKQIRLMIGGAWWQMEIFTLCSLIIALILFWDLYKRARVEAAGEYQAQARGLTNG